MPTRLPLAALLCAAPAFALDGGGAASARELMREALEREVVPPSAPPRLPDASEVLPGPSEKGREHRKGRGLETAGTVDEAARRAAAASAAAPGQLKQHEVQAAAEEHLESASQAAATRSRADAAKKAAPPRPRPPRP